MNGLTDQEVERLVRVYGKRIEDAGGTAGGGITNEAGAATLLGVKPRTLREWRRQDRERIEDGKPAEGPPCYFFRRWFYDLADLVRWLDAHRLAGRTRQIPAEPGRVRHSQKAASPGN